MTASTLLEVMQEHAADKVSADTRQSALHYWNGSQRTYFPLSYNELSKRAFAFGDRLLGMQNNAESASRKSARVVMIACHTPYATLLAFYGAISVGMVPMIFPMPLSLGSHRGLSERIHHWGLLFDQPAMLVLEEGLREKFHDDIPPEVNIARLSDNPEGEWKSLDAPAKPQHSPLASDVAFFQTTSSSTGDHKAVAISHQNIIANVAGIRRAVGMDADESMISWLPLFHDMGLVGAVLFSFCNDYPLFLMTPTQFIKRPALWLRGMAENQCTIATAPNFGYDYCSRLVSDNDAATLDLSKVKHLFIGAEPIRISTVDTFVSKFGASGISPQVIRPAYGLAESTIITSITAPNKVSQFVILDGGAIGINEPVKALDKVIFSDPRMHDYKVGQHVAACSAGMAIEDMKIEILDDQGNPVAGEGIAGEIAISGSSVAMGYVGGREEMINRFPNARMHTGDMGVLLDGELYIIERIKNLIIRNGENFLVNALEQQLAQLLNISHDHIAVFESNIHDPGSDIIVLVERHAPIIDAEIDALLVAMPKEAFPIDKILFCKSREIPRTTSGKKRHFYCRKMYLKGQIKYQQLIEISPTRIMQATAKASVDT